jgi:hypothetical protein
LNWHDPRHGRSSALEAATATPAFYCETQQKPQTEKNQANQTIDKRNDHPTPGSIAIRNRKAGSNAALSNQHTEKYEHRRMAHGLNKLRIHSSHTARRQRMSTLKAMIHNVKTSLELHMMAATFAQADDRPTAMELLQKGSSKTRRVENQLRKEEQRRMEEQRRLHL